MRHAFVLALAITISAPALAAGDEDRRKAWRELLEQQDPSASARQIEAVLSACGNKVEPLKALVASDAAYPDLKAGWLKESTTVFDGKTALKTEFLIRVPEEYSPRKSWPLILAGHGQGGSGADIGGAMEELIGKAVEKYVLICPTMPGEHFYNGRPYQEQAYLKPLAWARLRMNIDPDRIYITGYSQGGRCTWHLATMFERHFAAAVPMAGFEWFEGGPYTTYSYLGNLANLPLWAIWGDKDTAPPPLVGNVEVARETAARMKQLKCSLFTPTEMPGAGHGDSWPTGEEFVKYLAGHKRPSPPEQFTHAFHLPHHARGYYVEALRFTRPPLAFDKELRVEIPVRPGAGPPTSQEVRDLMQKKVDAGLYRISAKLDRTANSLSIRPEGVSAVRVYAIEGMFDLSRPVKITFGDKSWTGAIPASAACVLKHYAAERDRSQLVVNEIEIDSAGKVSIAYK